MRLVLLALPLLLAGCVSGAMAGASLGSAGAGAAIATFFQGQQLVDRSIADLKPAVKAWCDLTLAEPHSQKMHTALTAFCQNIPSDAVGILTQFLVVVIALDKERQQGQP